MPNSRPAFNPKGSSRFHSIHSLLEFDCAKNFEKARPRDGWNDPVLNTTRVKYWPPAICLSKRFASFGICQPRRPYTRRNNSRTKQELNTSRVSHSQLQSPWLWIARDQASNLNKKKREGGKKEKREREKIPPHSWFHLWDWSFSKPCRSEWNPTQKTKTAYLTVVLKLCLRCRLRQYMIHLLLQ